jgi:hypothetical protein
MLWYCVCFIRNEIPEKETSPLEKLDNHGRILISIALSIFAYKAISADRVSTATSEKFIERVIIAFESAHGIDQKTNFYRKILERTKYYAFKATVMSVCNKVIIPSELDFLALAEIVFARLGKQIDVDELLVLTKEMQNACKLTILSCSEIIAKKMNTTQFNDKLLSAVNDALCKLSIDDDYLLLNGLSERCLAHKFAMKLSALFPDYDIDVEYNRFEFNPKSIEVYESDMSRAISLLDKPLGTVVAKHVYPDVIIHKRGSVTNIAAFEIKRKSQCSPRQKAFDIFKLKKYSEAANTLKYLSGIFILLDDQPSNGQFEHVIEVYKDGSLVFSNSDYDLHRRIYGDSELHQFNEDFDDSGI